MNINECEDIIDEYTNWLSDEIKSDSFNGICKLTVPFLDRHNDHFQVYVEESRGEIKLTDDGYVLTDLEMSGLDISTPKRRKLLETILRGYGIKRSDQDELVVEASEDNLAQRVHSLIQAMISVNDMFVLAQPYTESLFWEDVKSYFDQNEVRYTDRVKISGKSGYAHQIDFLIPDSPDAPERFVKAINEPGKNSVSDLLFTVEDTRDTRTSTPEYFAFLNDREKNVGGDVIDALKNYDVIPARWSDREHFLPRLQN